MLHLICFALITFAIAAPVHSSAILSLVGTKGSIDSNISSENTPSAISYGFPNISLEKRRLREGIQVSSKTYGCSNGVCLDIVSLARSKGLRVGETLPLVFADSGYWPVLLNSFATLARVNQTLPAEVGVVCLDDDIIGLLRNVGAPPCLRLGHAADDGAHGDRVHNIWAVRVQQLQQLLQAGYGALFFDADVIWQADLRHTRILGTPLVALGSKIGGSRNTSSSFSANRSNKRDGVRSDGWSDPRFAFDVVASRGSFPNDVGSMWGATLCMGLVFFAPTPGSLALVSRLASRILPGKTFDDQLALNRILLHDAMLTWSSRGVIQGRAQKPARTANMSTKVTTDKASVFAKEKQGSLSSRNELRPSDRLGLKMFQNMKEAPALPLLYTSSNKTDIGVGKLNGTAVRVALLAHSIVPRRCEERYGIGSKQVTKALALHCFARKVRAAVSHIVT